MKCFRPLLHINIVLLSYIICIFISSKLWLNAGRAKIRSMASILMFAHGVWVRLLRKSDIWFSPLVNSLLPNIFILAKRVTLWLLVSFRRLELWSLEKVQLSQAPCGMCNKDHNNFHCLVQKVLPCSCPNIFFNLYLQSYRLQGRISSLCRSSIHLPDGTSCWFFPQLYQQCVAWRKFIRRKSMAI